MTDEFDQYKAPKDEFDQYKETQPPTTLQSVGKSLSSVVQGFGAGVAQIPVGLRDLANKGAKAIGIGELPDVPASLRQAATVTPEESASTAFGVGHGLEQATEFMAPGGLVSKAGRAVGMGARLLGAGENVQALARVGAKMLAEGAAAGGLTEVQTGGDNEAATKAALTAGVTTGAFSTIGGVLKGIAPALYKTGLRFPDRIPDAQVGDIIDDGIRNKILQTEGGTAKAGRLATARSAITDSMIAGHANDLIDIETVEGELEEMRDLADRIKDPRMMNKINRRWAEITTGYGATPGSPAVPPKQIASPILGPSGNPVMKTIPGSPAVPPKPAMITVGQAQQLKKDFQQIASESYGKANRQQLNKALASGYRESLEDIIPELKDANRSTQNALLLQDAIEGELNKHPGFTPDVVMASLMKPAAGEAMWLLRNPRVRSAMAIISDRTGRAVTAAAPGIGGLSAAQLAPPIPTQAGTQ